MFYPRELIQALEQLEVSAWIGVVYRHMLGEYSPELENWRGARWNPFEVNAIYASLGKETALAEAAYAFSTQPVRPRARCRLHTVEVRLTSVMDLRAKGALAKLGVTEKVLGGDQYHDCQKVGGAVAWLGHDGLLVPSARAEGSNLVIFPTNQTENYKFEAIVSEELNRQ